MQKKIQAFKDHVREAAANPGFVHHEWFCQYHLDIVERIALELLDKYPQADREVVMVLVWLHDYGKILDFDTQYETTLRAGRQRLTRLGFDARFVERVVSYAETLDSKMSVDLRKAPIEVQIVSSADGASHHVGPFMPEYWRENAGRTVEELMAGQVRKTMKDWERKMVLPEVREAFGWRHRAALEQGGELPDKFLD
jgi:hypothetical protein